MDSTPSVFKHPAGQNVFIFLSNRYRSPIALGIVVSYLIYFLFINPHPGFPKSMDYTTWVAAGKMVTSGQVSDLYNIAEQIRYQKAITYPFETPGGVLILNRPPFFVIPFIPLSLLPFTASYILWVLSILVTGVVAIWVIIKWIKPSDQQDGKTAWEWLIVSIAFFPVFQGILLGQTSFQELLILASVYLLLQRGKGGWAGAVLALGAFKPQLLIFFFPILILRRSWRGIVTFGLVGLFLLAISILMVGLRGMLDYVHITNQAYEWNCINGIYPELHQSWRGLLIGFMVPPCTQPDLAAAAVGSLNLANQLSNILNFLTILVVLLAWLRIWKTNANSAQFDLVFALTVLASLLASPYSNPQELTRLVLFAALIWRAQRVNPTMVPNWFNRRLLVVIAIAIGPLVMTAAARPYHPFVWLEVIVFVALAVIVFRPDFYRVQKLSEDLKTA